MADRWHGSVRYGKLVWDTHPQKQEESGRNRETWHTRGFMSGIMEWEVDHSDYYLRLWILEIKRNVGPGRHG